MILENQDDQLMAMAAHRYCLGRRSYIVSTCIEWLQRTWPQMTHETQNLIVRDTLTELVDGHAGDACDIKSWHGFTKWAHRQMTPDQQESLHKNLRYREIYIEFLETIQAVD